MKVLIIGDSASGKSTFALALSKKLSLPVIHLDEKMDTLGRNDKDSIRKFIETEIAKENWVIDGNAFMKDKEARIRAADMIITFDFNPLVSFFNHIKRYLKLRTRIEKGRVGSANASLNLRYFIPYIFIKFPKRKREAISLAHSLGKKVVVFRSRADAIRYLQTL